ncbi:MAG TPA: hypothetical protein VGL84_08000 [Gaiellaceae bacterium]|jgi:hypothetical protein
MSFASDLRTELARNGIRGVLADRIIAELDDHLACDPSANVGAPAEIATRFATELRIARTRRASVGAFAALAVCAVLLAVVVVVTNRPGYPVRTSAASAFAGLGLVAFAQIAFAAGVLALVRGLRGCGAGDLRLAQRRALVALAAGAGLCVCLALQGAAARPMPVWWHVASFAAALIPLPGLAWAVRMQRSAAAITPYAPAEGLSADLPVSPRLALTVLGAIVVAFVVAQGVVGERSLNEGLTRGAIEAAGLALGVVLLGRPLGLLSSAR